MNTLTILFGMLLCLAVANARHYGDRSESERTDDEETQGLRQEVDHTSHRHRRRRWQSSGGYDYQPSRYDYRDRRDYYRDQQDLIPQIYKLLDEISTYIRRQQVQPPPPPPQPIYIPYPVPYFVPKVVVCKTPVKSPNVTSRFPEMEDTNQNWGFVASTENMNDDYDDTDGARPISFDPIRPKQQMKRPAPSVEHGSSQSKTPVTTQAPFLGQGRTSDMSCFAATLTCCGNSDQASQKQCFINIGCAAKYDSKMCSSDAITEALENFKRSYAPVN